MKLLVATRNAGKLRELAKLLSIEGVELVGLDAFPDAPEVVEDTDTFEGNAIKKASELARATGLPTLADDSGLEVDALGGAPGVLSARYAGDDATYADNVAKLLRELQQHPGAARTARFRTVAVVAHPDGCEVVAEGVVDGHIIDEPRGEGGFGYDPVFVPVDGDGSTFAQMDADSKNAISHRGRAFRALAEKLAAAAR